MSESDFERIDHDPSLEDGQPSTQEDVQKPDFAQVIFHNIAEAYPTDAHIVCDYTITPVLHLNAQDYVGLFRVGWASARDHMAFQLSPMPSMHTPGKDVNNRVVFQAPYLPKDDGEFYQFCYVTSAGYVRGASTPFQFKKPMTDDYVAVEEDNMMMVMSRTAAIQVELKQTLSDKGKVEKQLKIVETERDDLLTKLVASENSASGACREKDQLTELLAVATDRISQLEKEREGLTSMHDSLRDKLDAITTEKTGMEKRLLEKDEYIASLQEKRKALIGEKDALTGKNKSLEQEKELFKNHFTSTESNVQKYQAVVEEQRAQLTDAEKTAQVLREEVAHLMETIKEEQAKVEAATNVKATNQVTILELTDNLQHSEDKLFASEAMVSMMKEETLAQSQVITKMSGDLEGAKSEAFNLQAAYAHQEKSHKAEKTKWLDERADMQAAMKVTEKDLTALLLKVEVLSEQATVAEGRTEAEQGSLYALQTAQISLRERYSKMKAEYTEMKKANETLHKRVKHHQQQESDLRRDATDLKERLTMGAEEYKTKYLEARKLETENRRLAKHLKRSRGPSEDSSTETEQIQSSSVTSQTATKTTSATATMTSQASPFVISCVQTAEAGTLSRVATSDVGTVTRQHVSDAGTSTTRWPELYESGDSFAMSGYEDIEGLAVPIPLTSLTPPATPPATPDKVDELTKEVAKRKSKQQKYKQLYHDEKQKIVIIQQYHYGEIEKRDTELDKERCRHAKKMAELQSRLMKQEQIIDRQKAHIEQVREQQIFVDPSPIQVDAGAAGAVGCGPEDPAPEDEANLGTPITALPAPIQPTVLPTAKMAAVKCLNERGQQEGLNMFLEPESTSDEDEGPPPVESGEPEEERFHDADGEPQKLCPSCNMTFPADFPQHVFEAHVDGHYGPVCPMCHEQFDVRTDHRAFEAHVQLHFPNE